MSKSKKYYRETRQEFLLSFFEEDLEDRYSEKQVNGFWLIKQWNGDKKYWQVAIYSQESYDNYQTGKEKFKLWKEQANLDI